MDHENPQTTCPVSKDCLFYDSSKECLSSHIISCHPDHAKTFQLEANNDFSTTFVNDTGPLERTSAPICAVKPLPPVSSRLVEDLADTVSAIEAICSLNNEPQQPPMQPFSSTPNHHGNSDTLFTDPFTNGNGESGNGRKDVLPGGDDMGSHELHALEDTHRQFELAVQDAELVVPESSDSNYFLQNPNIFSKAENVNDSEPQNNSARVRNSTTRSDIESDSGVESVNSHHFQNSPLYSPMQSSYKNYTSPSPSAGIIPHEKEERNGEFDASTKGYLNNSITKQNTLSRRAFEAVFSSNSNFNNKSIQLDSLSTIESNFPEVFGGSTQGDMPSFSDMIEAETLKLFGDDGGGLDTPGDNPSLVNQTLNTTIDSPAFEIPQNCPDALCPEKECTSASSLDNSPTYDRNDTTPISEKNSSYETIETSIHNYSNSSSMRSSSSNEHFKANQIINSTPNKQDVNSDLRVDKSKKSFLQKRKISDDLENSLSCSKKARIRDSISPDPQKAQKYFQDGRSKKLGNKNEDKQKKNQSTKDSRNNEVKDSASYDCDIDSDMTPGIQNKDSNERKDAPTPKDLKESAHVGNEARVSNITNKTRSRLSRPGPKSKKKKLEKVTEDEEHLSESSPSKSSETFRSPFEDKHCDTKNKKENKSETKGSCFRTELLNELHKSITNDQGNCIVAKTALSRKNGPSPVKIPFKSTKSPMKNNEIESNLLTCIDACFPKIAEQKKKSVLEDESLQKNNSHVKSKLFSSLKSDPKEDVIENVSQTSKHSRLNGTRKETEVRETVKQSSDQSKALLKHHEHDIVMTEKVEKQETTNFGATPTKMTKHSSIFSKEVQNQSHDDKTFACPKCGRKYQYENFLKVHMKRC